MPNQSIFVTGIGGKIGHFLIRELEGDCIWKFLLLIRKYEDVAAFDGKNIARIVGDLLRPESYAAALHGVDTILHMAAVTHTNSKRRYYEVNAEATLELVKAAKQNRVKRIIFISTRAVGENGGAYSNSKLIAEGHVRQSGLEWVILRLAEVYGVSSDTGMDMLVKKASSLPFIPIVGNGEYRLMPVHISDVVSTINTILKRTDLNGRIYNIAGPEVFTYNQLVDKILSTKAVKRAKVHIPIILVNVAANILSALPDNGFLVRDQVPRLLLDKDEDISLAVKEFGFNPIAIETFIKGTSDGGI